MKHSWAYGADEEAWMQTTAGKHVGGFARCRGCGLMRFSIAGRPPQHFYVKREWLEANRCNTTIRPGAPGVEPTAGECKP